MFLARFSPRITASSRTYSRRLPFSSRNRLIVPRQTIHAMTSQAKFSPGSDEGSLKNQTTALVEQKGWALDEDGMGVSKTYYFATYTKALDFLQIVGIRSKSKNHHATMTINFGSVYVHWTTHHPRGLSAKDAYMAQYCDEHAEQIGTTDMSKSAKCGPS